MRAMIWMAGVMVASTALAAKAPAPIPEWKTPEIPGGASVITVESADLLHQPAEATVALKDGVRLAKTPPRVDFAFYPGQTYRGKPWSNWSDGCVLNGKYYSALSDHLAPSGSGFLYEFDPGARTVRLLADLKSFLVQSKQLATNELYTPGKVHSRVLAGQDGWLYYSTHRGSPRECSDAVGYRGDWILRTRPDPDPAKVKTEVVMAYPVAKHSMPASALDTNRMIFYAGTVPGPDAADQGNLFLAVDVASRQTLLVASNGFDRYAMIAKSTGRLYWGAKSEAKGSPVTGLKFDPEKRAILPCPAVPHVRACTAETADGKIYGVSGNACDIWMFDTKTETLTPLGDGSVGNNTYVTSMDIDPSGRYLYYVPGAHGGGPREGTPVIQFDVKTRTRKVIAFMNAMAKQAGAVFEGTFSTALNETGDTLFVTWNMGRPKWDCAGVTAIHIPASERE
jgi:hypothetical protein